MFVHELNLLISGFELIRITRHSLCRLSLSSSARNSSSEVKWRRRPLCETLPLPPIYGKKPTKFYYFFRGTQEISCKFRKHQDLYLRVAFLFFFSKEKFPLVFVLYFLKRKNHMRLRFSKPAETFKIFHTSCMPSLSGCKMVSCMFWLHVRKEF